MELFQYFATETQTKSESFVNKTTKGKRSQTFDDIAKAESPGAKTSKKPKETVTQIGYVDFLKYCGELGISNTLGLTTIDVGDIYLTTIAAHHKADRDYATFASMTFPDVWESLIRCAYTVYKKKTDCSLVDKMKGMFNTIWRYLQQSHRSSTNPSNFVSNPKFRRRMRCFQLFNERFINMWTKDEFRDYFNVTEKSHTETPVSSVGLIMRGEKAVVPPVQGGSSSPSKNTPPPPPPPKSPNNGEDDPTDTIGNEGLGDIEMEQELKINLQIEGTEDFGDPRMTPQAIVKLLKNRPDLAVLLHECMVEEGIVKE
jgi:hypothetical protein